jgi:hypothetical protein
VNQRVGKAVLYWLDAFDGVGYTFVFLLLAFWLRVFLVITDVAVSDG